MKEQLVSDGLIITLFSLLIIKEEQGYKFVGMLCIGTKPPITCVPVTCWSWRTNWKGRLKKSIYILIPLENRSFQHLPQCRSLCSRCPFIRFGSRVHPSPLPYYGMFPHLVNILFLVVIVFLLSPVSSLSALT